MKVKMSVILALGLGLALGFASCKKEDKDNEKPVINLKAPKDGAKLTIGKDVHFDCEFSDNKELASYKVDIHNAFDGHTHKTRGEEHKHDEVPFKFEKSWDLSGSKSKPVHHHEIKIEMEGKHIKAGKYHLLVYCKDKAGNESHVARDIELVEGDPHGHGHEHKHEEHEHHGHEHKHE